MIDSITMLCGKKHPTSEGRSMLQLKHYNWQSKNDWLPDGGLGNVSTISRVWVWVFFVSCFYVPCMNGHMHLSFTMHILFIYFDANPDEWKITKFDLSILQIEKKSKNLHSHLSKLGSLGSKYVKRWIQVQMYLFIQLKYSWHEIFYQDQGIIGSESVKNLVIYFQFFKFFSSLLFPSMKTDKIKGCVMF